jgi:hypothetical protein
MSKKDFEAIASVLQECRRDMDPGSATYSDPDALHADVCLAFATRLGRQNPHFDRERFLRACVPGANVGSR